MARASFGPLEQEHALVPTPRGGFNDHCEEANITAVIDGVALELASVLDKSALASAMQRIVDQLLPVEYTGLYFYDPAARALRFAFAKGFTEEQRDRLERTAMERKPGRVFLTKEVSYVPDTEMDGEKLVTARLAQPIRSRLFLPILYRDQSVGVLSLASVHKNYFHDKHMAVAQFLSRMTGVVYTNLHQIDELNKQLDLIRAQREELIELSAPLIQVGDGVLLLALIGAIDVERAHHARRILLQAIAMRRAHSILLDLTGTIEAERSTAEALVQIAQAVKLMGAHCAICGIRPSIAAELSAREGELKGIVIYGTAGEALSAILPARARRARRQFRTSTW